MFYIRADANEIIGTGHIMRCMSIAEEMRSRGIEVIFITADNFPDEIIFSRKFQSICLNSKWEDLDNEVNVLSRLIRNKKIHIILIDSYFITYKYLQEICKLVKVIYIDDLGEINYPVDVLINYNIYAKGINYKKLLDDGNTKLLLGEKYVPLRSEFHNIKTSFREKVQSVLISTGGADNYNITGKLLKNIINVPDFSDIQFYVISGKLNSGVNKLLDMEKAYNNIHICQNVIYVSEIMCKCDVAISACGLTMYELCACGVPVLTFSFADNQIPGLNGFEEKELAVNCGGWCKGMEMVISNICVRLKEFILNTCLRKKMYTKIINLIDGNGSKRIVNEIMNIYKNNIF